MAIENLLPTASGTYTEFTSLGGAPTHWEAVDDPVGEPDDLTTYISNNTLTYETDTFNMEDFPYGPSTINSVTVFFRYRGTNTVNISIQPLLYLGGETTFGTIITEAGTGNYKNAQEALDRPGGGDWTVDDIDNLEAGVKARLNALPGNSISCTQLYLIIDYTLLPPGVATIKKIGRVNTSNIYKANRSIVANMTKYNRSPLS